MATDKQIQNARNALQKAHDALVEAKWGIDKALDALSGFSPQISVNKQIHDEVLRDQERNATNPNLPDWLRSEPKEHQDTDPEPEPLQEEITITDEWRFLLARMNDGKDPLFITGPAGTGKSTLLNYFAARFEKPFAIVAPTGVAALRIGGQTIHSFFRFAIHALDEHDMPDIPPRYRAKYRALHTLIIDEISMVRADMMDMIDLFLRKYGPVPDLPFGGVRLIMIGDPYQLPPVSREKAEKAWLKGRYGSECPFFFQALIWQQVPIDKHELTTIFRQSDPVFTGILNAARNGGLNNQHIAMLNSRVQPTFRPALDDLWITLTTTNDSADYSNRRMLDQLPGKSRVFKAQISGDFEPRNAPTDVNLELKVGAIVMFVKNSSDHYWVNGSLGRVTNLDPLRVALADSSREYEVIEEDWEQIAYEYDAGAKRLHKYVKGVFTQIPLRLAAAITIHKAQGVTLQRAIIDFGRGTFADGQGYVAFSRCRELSGIVLRSPVSPGDFMVNAAVKAFMNGGPVVLPQVGPAQMNLLESGHD